MTPTNPERLWAFEVGHDARVACSTAGDATAHYLHVEDKERVSPVAEYVRAEVVVAEREALLARIEKLRTAMLTIGERSAEEGPGFADGILAETVCALSDDEALAAKGGA